MSNTKISALPFKQVLNSTDVIPIVDTQFGSVNYVNKKTTVGSLTAVTEIYVNNKIIDLGLVTSVNGQTKNVILSLSQLHDVTISSPSADQFLAYNPATSKWTNVSFQTVDTALDCGEF
jgi:hypothetical protein